MRMAFVTGAASLLIVSCAAVPSQRDLQLPAVMLTVVGTRSVVDVRSRFRSLFCEVLLREPAAQRTEPCDEFLWRLPDEKPAVGSTVFAYALESRVSVLIVGGAFGDCYPPASSPFADSVERLKGQGVYIDYVAVSGRSTAELNARTIANRIAAVPRDVSQPLILIGYSKGVADILEALTRYPEAAASVSAVVSVAGAVNGSPLAGRYLGIYDHLASNLAFGACPPGNGGVLESLTRPSRLTWLADNPIPSHIRYYSLGTFTTPPRLARILAYSQRQLSKIDARNDGQLLLQDELIPGSELLGYANADHWAVAVQMEDRFPFLAHRSVGKHPFPQRALFESILMFVQADLRQSAVQQ